MALLDWQALNARLDYERMADSRLLSSAVSNDKLYGDGWGLIGYCLKWYLEMGTSYVEWHMR